MGKKKKNKGTSGIDREIREAKSRIARLTKHLKMLEQQKSTAVSPQPKGMLPQNPTKFDYVIEFDGGTSSNIPALGFGEGYGSYKINNEEVKRVKFGKGHSCNSAEILTLVYALAEIIDKNNEECSHVSVLCRGDSKIALKWANPNLKSTPSESTSQAFQDAIKEMRTVNCLFGRIKTEWRGRIHSVKLFGH